MSIPITDATEYIETAAQMADDNEITKYDYIPNWHKLPLKVKQEFIRYFKANEEIGKPQVNKVVEESDNSTYYTVSRRKVAKSLEDFVINEFIPSMDWDDKRLMLRSDSKDKGINYLSSALSAYNVKYLYKANTETEVFEENPYPDKSFNIVLL